MAAILIFIMIGIVFIILGWLIWKKEKIELLHSYHRDKVKEENKKAFCRISGIGTLLIGAGMVIAAVIAWLTDSMWSFAIFAFYFAIGLALMIYAGSKYNK